MVLKRELFPKVLLVLGLTLLPLYVTKSGGVQPSHLLLLLFSIFYLSSFSFKIPHWSKVLFIFFIYVLIVEYLFTVAGGYGTSLINAFYIAFNFIISLAIYNFCKREDSLITVKYGVVLSCVFAVIGVLLYGFSLKVGSSGQRALGTFNNPNQLGYFAVCAASLLFFLNKNGYFKGGLAYLFILFSLLLSILSLSKAAIVANLFLFVLTFAPNKIKVKNFLSVLVVFGILVTATGFLSLNGYLDDLVFYNRLLNMFDEGDSSAEARGYFVFLDGTSLEIIFGLGYDQIYKSLGHEVHSSLGSVLNNYGIIGFSLFFIVMVVWGIHLYINFGLMIFLGVWLPPFLYGLTHNGTRFVLYWVLIAVTISVCRTNTNVDSSSYYSEGAY